MKNYFQTLTENTTLQPIVPPVVSYIEKYYPELIDNLAPIIPHMITTAKVLHEKHGNDLKIVYISPCIAAKNEIKKIHRSRYKNRRCTYLYRTPRAV